MSFRRVQRTARAQEDIDSIAKWISRDSVEAALRWLEQLDQKLERLASTPGSGTDRSELRPQMRSSPLGNYLVFFKPVASGIQVIRVLHGARDYSRFFQDDETS